MEKERVKLGPINSEGKPLKLNLEMDGETGELVSLQIVADEDDKEKRTTVLDIQPKITDEEGNTRQTGEGEDFIVTIDTGPKEQGPPEHGGWTKVGEYERGELWRGPQKMSITPGDPAIETRLKELGILEKVGNRHIITDNGRRKIFQLWRKDKTLTPAEYAYIFFLETYPTKKEQQVVETIHYTYAPGELIQWYTFKKTKPSKANKHPAGKHFIDNLLKSNEPKSHQLNLFETTSRGVQEKIISKGYTAELINRKGEGIKLSKGEYKLAMCLSKLLHDKSQTLDKKRDDYYTGNKEALLTTFKTNRGDLVVKSPTISFTLYEIAKEFYGGGEIGGENIRIVARILYDLAEDPSKRALIRYHKRVDQGGGLEREYFIEQYDSLVSTATVGFKDMLEGKQIDEQREIVVNLHPVYIDSMDKIRIDIPTPRGIIEAYGSPNVSEITQKLIYDLSRAHSNKKKLKKDPEGNHIYTIGQNKLYWKIAESYMNRKTGKAKRGKLIKEYFDKSIETAKVLGLILGYEVKPGSTGEPMVNFTLSKDW